MSRAASVFFVVAFVFSVNACAGVIDANTWYGFHWNLGSVETFGAIPQGTGVTTVKNPGTAPWTYASSSTTSVEIVDGFLPGDFFELFDSNVSQGLTSIPPVSSATSCNGGDDPLTCATDPNFSRGTFQLAAGSHSLTINVPYSPNGEGFAWFRVKEQGAVPEMSTAYLVGAGLALALGWSRYKRS